MPVALQTRSAASADEYVSVAEAAALLGESARTWQRRAKDEATRAVKEGRQSLAILQPPPSGSGKPVWWLHRRFDARLARIPTKTTRDDRAKASLLTEYPQHAVEAAYRKAYWLRAWRTACESRRGVSDTEVTLANRIVREARAAEEPGFSISVRSLQGWHKTCHRLGADGQIVGVRGLVDQRAMASRTGDGDGDASGGRDADACDYFYECFHTEQKLSAALCHELTVREAERHGWTWPASYSATRKWLQCHDNLALRFLMREGKDKWCRRFMPHIEINYRLILAAARAALGAGRGLSKRPQRPRVSDDLLRGPVPSLANDQTETSEDATKDGCEETGTDAARQSSTDLLKLIGGGHRHGQEQQ